MPHGPRGTSGGAPLAAGSSSVGDTLSASTRMGSPGVLSKRSRAVAATWSGTGVVKAVVGVGVEDADVALGMARSSATLGTTTGTGLYFPRAGVDPALAVPGRALTAGPSADLDALLGADEGAAEEEAAAGAPPEKVGPSKSKDVWMALANFTRSCAEVRRKASMSAPSSVPSRRRA